MYARREPNQHQPVGLFRVRGVVDTVRDATSGESLRDATETHVSGQRDVAGVVDRTVRGGGGTHRLRAGSADTAARVEVRRFAAFCCGNAVARDGMARMQAARVGGGPPAGRGIRPVDRSRADRQRAPACLRRGADSVKFCPDQTGGACQTLRVRSASSSRNSGGAKRYQRGSRRQWA
jgi:hypothetical protein